MTSFMSETDKARLLDLYHGRLAELGDDVRTVGWRSADDQRLRFSVLCRSLDLRGKRVLDVGCGLGDLVPFLEETYGPDFDYIGIDIAPNLVARAQERFGGPRRTFIATDLLSADAHPIDPVDVAMLSGALTFKVADNMTLATAMIHRMWGLASEAVALNFMSSYVDFQLDKNFHYRPEDMFAVGKALTRWVTLHHDYPLFEFTLQLLRKPR